MGLLNKTNPKFKVGDRVKVLDGTGIPDYIGSWTHDMQWYVGREKTISRVLHTRRGRHYYYLEGCVFSWDERGLEKVGESKPRFKVGDPVRVISGYGKPYHGIDWFPGMSKLIGKDVFITEVHSIRDETCTIYCYKVSDDPSPLGWWLGEDWIVPRSTDEKQSSSEGGEKEVNEALGRMLDMLVSDEKSEFSIGDRVKVKSLRNNQDGLALKAKEPYVGAVGCIDGKGVFGYKVNGLPSSWLPDELEKVDPRTLTPKYKVGDTVRVLDGRNDRESKVYWVDGDGMTKCIGLECTIQEVCAHVGYVSYRFSCKVSPWCFDERWLVPADQASPTDDKVPSDLPDEPATIHFLPFERR